MRNLSINVENIEISGIRKFYNKVNKIQGAISLTLGEPDFKVPEEIKESMKKAIDENKTNYTQNAGIVDLRLEICRYLEGMNIKYEVEEVCVTVGGSEGLLSTFTALLNPNDEVLIPSIAYPAYESCVKILGGKVINYGVKADLSIDIDELRELIKERKPKVLVISYPSNPTGVIMNKEHRDELYEILKDEDIIIVSDEIYSSIVFDEYYSLCQYENLRSKCVLIGGFSKMFSMTGIRVGYVCAPCDIMNNIIKVHQYNVSCAPSIGQYGALEGLKKCAYHIEETKAEFLKRRNYVYDRLKSMGLEVNMPEGAFYIFPNIKKYNMSSEEFCERLLNEKGIAIVPGSAFGPGGEGYIRISYCYSMENLKKALDGMEAWLRDLNKNI